MMSQQEARLGQICFQDLVVVGRSQISRVLAEGLSGLPAVCYAGPPTMAAYSVKASKAQGQ